MSDPRMSVFPLGQHPPESLQQYFSGEVFLQMLVLPGAPLDCPVGNVTFAPGCRNRWHYHAGGQILLVTAGRGWYQEWGQPARELHPGDVVTIGPGVKHWHGAAKDSWFSHLSVEAHVEKGAPTWLEPVAQADYDKLP